MMTEIRICSYSKTYNYWQRRQPQPALLHHLWSVEWTIAYGSCLNIRLLAGLTSICFTYFMLL